MVFVGEEEVVEISAYRLCRIHGRVYLELVSIRERRENMRQHARLYPLRHLEIVVDAFEFRFFAVFFFKRLQFSLNVLVYHEAEYHQSGQ